MNTRQVTKNYRLEQWALKISERKNSGLTIKNWCEQEGITQGSYYYWLKQVRQAACEPLPDFTNQETTTLVPIKLNHEQPEPNISQIQQLICLSYQDFHVEFSDQVKPEFITHLLKELKNVY